MSVFTVNENPVERGIRIAIGVGLISIVFVGPQTSWGWIGVVPLLTGVSGLCPLYTVFGISTCRKRG